MPTRIVGFAKRRAGLDERYVSDGRYQNASEVMRDLLAHPEGGADRKHVRQSGRKLHLNDQENRCGKKRRQSLNSHPRPFVSSGLANTM